MKKILLSIFLTLSFAFAFAGTFEKLDFTDEQQKSLPKNSVYYSYTGTVEKSDEDVFKKISEKYKKNLYVVIDSNGGEFISGLLMGYTTVINENHIIVEKAWSAAGMWAVADKKREYLNDESEIMLHLPYSTEKIEKPELFMQLGCLTRDYLQEFFGLEEAKSLMSKMNELRDKNGINAGIVFNKKGKFIRK
jgi:serine/threonine protein phosphatase PrpC